MPQPAQQELLGPPVPLRSHHPAFGQGQGSHVLSQCFDDRVPHPRALSVAGSHDRHITAIASAFASKLEALAHPPRSTVDGKGGSGIIIDVLNDPEGITLWKHQEDARERPVDRPATWLSRQGANADP